MQQDCFAHMTSFLSMKDVTTLERSSKEIQQMVQEVYLSSFDNWVFSIETHLATKFYDRAESDRIRNITQHLDSQSREKKIAAIHGIWQLKAAMPTYLQQEKIPFSFIRNYTEENIQWVKQRLQLKKYSKALELLPDILPSSVNRALTNKEDENNFEGTSMSIWEKQVAEGNAGLIGFWIAFSQPLLNRAELAMQLMYFWVFLIYRDEFPLFLSYPVLIIQLIRITMLCMNDIFQSERITRIAAKYQQNEVLELLLNNQTIYKDPDTGRFSLQSETIESLIQSLDAKNYKVVKNFLENRQVRPFFTPRTSSMFLNKLYCTLKNPDFSDPNSLSQCIKQLIWAIQYFPKNRMDELLSHQKIIGYIQEMNNQAKICLMKNAIMCGHLDYVKKLKALGILQNLSKGERLLLNLLAKYKQYADIAKLIPIDANSEARD